MMGLFGKSPSRDPKEQVREWTSKLRKEQNQIERQVRQIQRQEAKVEQSLKQAAKKGDKDVCKVLAKEIINSRKAVNKMYASKAHINSIQMQMQNQLSVVRVTGALEKSTHVMQSMQQLVKIPEIQATMRELSKEMMKAGIIEEMVEDTMEGLEDDDLEEAADTEVEKVLWELTKGQLGEAPDAVGDTLPAVAGATAAPDSEEEEDVGAMAARLEALRSWSSHLK